MPQHVSLPITPRRYGGTVQNIRSRGHVREFDLLFGSAAARETYVGALNADEDPRVEFLRDAGSFRRLFVWLDTQD